MCVHLACVEKRRLERNGGVALARASSSADLGKHLKYACLRDASIMIMAADESVYGR